MDDGYIEIVRGNSSEQSWQFMADADTPYDFTGWSVTLFVKWRGGAMVKSSADPGSGLTLDPVTGTVTWTYTPAESRSIPAGRVARYELERRSGALQERLLTGPIIAVDGPNDD